MNLQHLQICIEEALEQLFPPRDLLWQAARYSLFSGGKRLRPLLTLATTFDLKKDIQAALQPACAIEAIHTYSLIHDDLPAMDNDDFRRGKPTLHRIYSEGHSILTGDFLLTYTFELLSLAPHLTAEQKISLVKILSYRTGALGMIGGQVTDIASKEIDIDQEALHSIHLRKTAALISAAMEFAAIICDLPAKEQLLLSNAGEFFGLAFQIQDDLLDAHVKEEVSAVTLYGTKKAEELMDKYFFNGIACLDQLACSFPLLKQLTLSLVHRTN